LHAADKALIALAFWAFRKLLILLTVSNNPTLWQAKPAKIAVLLVIAGARMGLNVGFCAFFRKIGRSRAPPRRRVPAFGRPPPVKGQNLCAWRPAGLTVNFLCLI
jgi:hypothetical protein